MNPFCRNQGNSDFWRDEEPLPIVNQVQKNGMADGAELNVGQPGVGRRVLTGMYVPFNTRSIKRGAEHSLKRS